MPNEPSGQKFPTSLNGGSTKEKVHHLTQDHSSHSIDLDFNFFTKEMSEAKRHGPGEKGQSEKLASMIIIGILVPTPILLKRVSPMFSQLGR